VVILDFSYKRKKLEGMIKEAEWLLVLDHHKSAERELEGVDNCFFDMGRSGCQMAWDFFFPEQPTRPLFLDYIADRDLWRWKMPDSKAFSKGLYVFHDLGFETFDKLMDEETRSWAYPYKDLIRRGENYLEHEAKLVGILAKSAKLCKMGDYTVYAIENRLFRSELGNILSERPDCDFAVIYSYDLKGKEWWISLRGDKKKSYDLSKISAEYCGGGHALAAGFTYRGDISSLLQLCKIDNKKSNIHL
jgi:oligoribonuclease NrnB/cAMP/cGMP phosphodiesterase (DHH superfamily)